MAAGAVELPAGFTLDQPASGGLPDGFKLDAPAQPSALRTYLGDMAEGWKWGGPMGAAIGASKQANELIEHGAYRLGGAATDVATNMGASPETAAKIGFGTNVAAQAVPAFIGGAAAGKLASPALESGARSLMQSALKPGIADLRTGKAAKAIDTMLDEGINVSQGGLAKLREKIGSLNDEIFEAIKNSPATVDKNKVASALLIPLKRFEMQVNPATDVKAIEKAWEEFVAHPLLAGSKDIPVATAQAMKQGTYKALGEKAYGELKGADIEAQKHLARGLKEGIAEAVPGIADKNAAESQLLNALNLAERRVLMNANKNPMGLSLLAKNPSAWAAFMADRSPLFKSLAARMLNSGAETVPATAAGAGIGAYVGQRE